LDIKVRNSAELHVPVGPAMQLGRFHRSFSCCSGAGDEKVDSPLYRFSSAARLDVISTTYSRIVFSLQGIKSSPTPGEWFVQEHRDDVNPKVQFTASGLRGFTKAALNFRGFSIHSPLTNNNSLQSSTLKLWSCCPNINFPLTANRVPGNRIVYFYWLYYNFMPYKGTQHQGAKVDFPLIPFVNTQNLYPRPLSRLPNW